MEVWQVVLERRISESTLLLVCSNVRAEVDEIGLINPSGEFPPYVHGLVLMAASHSVQSLCLPKIYMS